MIIINCGMPKSGTTLLMEYQKDLIRHLKPQNGLEKFKSHFPTEYFPNADHETVGLLSKISDQYGDFIIKTHSKPSSWIRNLVANHKAKISFSFRDPRDIMLSAIDHGERSRQGIDPSHAFAKVCTSRDAIPLAKSSIKLYYAWRRYGQALFVKYENLVLNKIQYLKNLASYFGYRIEEKKLYTIFQKHEHLKEQAWNFNKGAINRWETEMSKEEAAFYTSLFKKDLVTMGYSLLQE